MVGLLITLKGILIPINLPINNNLFLVPEVPRAIKAVVSNPTSIVVSWLPPGRTNGILTSYNLQIRSVGGPNEKDSKPKRYENFLL